MEKIQITRGYLPGAIGKIVELHGTYYSSNWSSGLFFEAKVAREMAGFLERYDDNRDGFWIASADGRIERSIAVDGIKAAGEGAHLRWFIVSDRLRQKGVGNRLFSTAVDFCRRKHTAGHISGRHCQVEAVKVKRRATRAGNSPLVRRTRAAARKRTLGRETFGSGRHAADGARRETGCRQCCGPRESVAPGQGI